LENKGIAIGCMDMLIASHAMSLSVTLVTNNIRQFERILELHLERPYVSDRGRKEIDP